MTDLNEWIKERRRIHDAATGGVWVHDEYTGVEGIVYPDTAFAEAVADCGDRDDSAAIVDAHNNLPALLTAVEKVLELHEPEEYEDPAGTFFCRTCGDWNMCEDPMGEQPDYPCPTVRAIEGAINE